MDRVRFNTFVAVGFSLILLILSANAGAASRPPVKPMKSVTVVPRWHLIATGLDPGRNDPIVAADTRFLVLAGQDPTSPNAQFIYRLLNIGTDQQAVISPPDCATEPSEASFAGLGGMYLALQCRIPTAVAFADTYKIDLLNLFTGQWTEKTLDPSVCDAPEAGCQVAGIGSSWLRFSTPPFDYHDPPPLMLQNIATGAVMNDRAIASDSLNNATGISHPCRSIPAGLSDEDTLGAPTGVGNFVQLGHFLLSTGLFNIADKNPFTAPLLQSCISKTSITIGGQYQAASDDMVVWEANPSSRGPLQGLFLPSLRTFVIRENKGSFAAVSNNTIYESTLGPNIGGLATDEIWATSVPTTRHRPEER